MSTTDTPPEGLKEGWIPVIGPIQCNLERIEECDDVAMYHPSRKEWDFTGWYGSATGCWYALREGSSIAIANGFPAPESDELSTAREEIAAWRKLAEDLAESLKEVIDYDGGASSALEDEYVIDRASAVMARFSEMTSSPALPGLERKGEG